MTAPPPLWPQDFLDGPAKVGFYKRQLLGTAGGSERVIFALHFIRGQRVRPYLALRFRGRYYHPFP